jgi:hypothetical protein
MFASHCTTINAAELRLIAGKSTVASEKFEGNNILRPVVHQIEYLMDLEFRLREEHFDC